MKSSYAYCSEWYREIRENPSSYYVEPFRICGNLYFVGNRDGASHLVDTGDGLILFDTNYPNMSGMLLQAIWKCGFRPEDIRMIFHTHGHFDHFGATKLLARLSGARTFLGEKDARMFREEPRLALCEYLEGIPTEFFEPDVEVRDQDEFVLGNTVVRAIATPGHSQGAVTYEIFVTDVKETRKAILCGGTGFNTLCGDFVREHHNESWRRDFEHSLEIWKDLNCDIYLGNHTPQSRTLEKRAQMREGGPNPFLDGGVSWRHYVQELQGRYDRMLREEEEN